MELEDNFFLLTAFLTHRVFLLSGSTPILQGGLLVRGKTSSAQRRITLNNSMPNTPSLPAETAREEFKTWVKSQWKL